MKYTLKFLQFYKEFFEEDGYKWTLQEVKKKLIKDKIKEYIIDRNESLKPPLEKYIWSNDHNEHYFNILKRDIFQKDFPKSMDDYVNMLI